jgi:hypothetical protein
MGKKNHHSSKNRAEKEDKTKADKKQEKAELATQGFSC